MVKITNNSVKKGSQLVACLGSFVLLLKCSNPPCPRGDSDTPFFQMGPVQEVEHLQRMNWMTLMMRQKPMTLQMMVGV